MDDTTPINDMDLDMIEAELNDTSTTVAPTVNINELTVDQANVAVDNLSSNRFNRPEAIYLFGLDSMSTKDIQLYCENTALKKVEWIDDSSCVLVFDNASDAYLAAQDLLQEPSDISTILSSTDLRTSKPFVRPDIATNGTEEERDPTLPPVRPVIDDLQIRMATDSDVKTRGARQRSRYYLIHGEPPKERRPIGSNVDDDDGSIRTTPDGKPLSILDRLGSRVPPMSASRRGRYLRQHDDDEYNNSSRYDRSNRRYHSRRRSLSPARESTDHLSTAEKSENEPTGANMVSASPPPTTTTSEQNDDTPYEIPESIRRRLGEIN